MICGKSETENLIRRLSNPENLLVDLGGYLVQAKSTGGEPVEISMEGSKNLLYLGSSMKKSRQEKTERRVSQRNETVEMKEKGGES